MNGTWVLTPCHRPRLDDLRASLSYLGHPVERTVVVTTIPEPIHETDVAATVLLDDQPGINISRWWNLGLDWIADQQRGNEWPYTVCCMESDVRISTYTLDVLSVVLRTEGLAMVGADWYSVTQEPVEIRRALEPWPLQHRIPGVCMVVAGELGLRFDEQFRWWYADDDFEWQHRKAGGTGLVKALTIEHGPGRPLQGERARFAEVDLQRFIAKWGSRHIR